jgi:hypothetical protein
MDALTNFLNNCGETIVEKKWFTLTFEHCIEHDNGFIKIAIDRKTNALYATGFMNGDKTAVNLSGSITEKSSVKRITKLIGEWKESLNEHIKVLTEFEEMLNKNREKSKEFIEKCQSVYGGQISKSAFDERYILGGGLVYVSIDSKNFLVEKFLISDPIEFTNKVTIK